MFTQKRFIPLLIVTSSVMFVLACQSVSRMFNTATPATNKPPAFPSSETTYDGDWKGETSQGLEITFKVAHNGIIAMNFQAEWEGPNCSQTLQTKRETTIDPTAEAAGYFPFGDPIENGAFKIANDTSSVDGTAFTLIGTFLSPDAASGTLEYAVTSGSCQGTENFDWTATRVSE